MNDDSDEQPKHHGPTVVGLGASAGGLAALRHFFAHVPADSGLAFVIVVHLSPEHESHLATLLQPHISIPVQQVSETVALEPNRVYVIPPGRNLSTIDTHLRLSPLEAARRDRAPIDHFFRTLAETHDGDGVAIVLTGTGSDGALGLKAIKEAGGLTVAQDPNEAEYDGMPQSAIATGMVDLTLPLSRIPEAVIRFAETEPSLRLHDEIGVAAQGDERLLQKVFAQLRARTGRDFSHYKRSTLRRRIVRRMQLAYVEDLQSYLALLRDNADEVRALADDLLITVTNFFRDPEVFETLAQEVIPRIFDDKAPEQSVRVWSVGCATGEEAYSLAILLLEEATRRESPPRLQVFASDLHERSLAVAREGFYPGDLESEVSRGRLQRFFQREDGGYRINKEVRELVIFAPHNLLGDPPFSRLDLISCRNVLIYLQRGVQKDVIELFHYALRPEGILLLGTSETCDSSELFRTEDKKRCIYRKRNVPAPEPRLPVFPATRRRTGIPVVPDSEDPAEAIRYGVLHQRMVELYGPPSVLVSPDDKIVHLSEHAGRYLVHPGGEMTSNALKLIREELRIELRAALHAARETGSVVRSKPIAVRLHGEPQPVVIDVRPAAAKGQEGFALVIFDERPHMLPAAASEHDSREGLEPSRALELRAELDVAQQRLQAVIEEYETGQEEMKASNEELQSANEELRSTMEELETSKEELQSMNEELQTVNQENRHKVEELAQLSGDLQNLLAATDIATLFLDRDLRIVRFTPKIGELFNIRPADRGRPLSDLTHRLGYTALQEDARSVIARLAPVEREVQDEAERWYLTRVLPYRSTDDRIVGAVVTFVDITSRKKAEEALRRSEEFQRIAVEAGEIGSWEYDVAAQQWLVSPKMSELLDAGPDASTLSHERWLAAVVPEDREAVSAALEQACAGSGAFEFTFRVRARDGGARWLYSRGRMSSATSSGTVRIHGAAIDVTHRQETEQALRESEERFRALVDASAQIVWTTDARGRVVEESESWRAFTGQSFEQWVDAVHPEDRESATSAWRRAVEAQEPLTNEFRLFHAASGTHRLISVRAVPLRNAARKVRGWVGMNVDITDQRAAEDALRESEGRFRTLADNIAQLAWMADGRGRVSWYNERWFAYTGTTPDEMKRTGWQQVLHPDYADDVAHGLEQCFASGDVWEDTFPLRRADGEYRWFLSRAVPIRDGAEGAENIVRWFGTHTDVTQQRVTEERLREADERKDEFLATLSHELRNPLAAIRNATEVLDHDASPEARQRAHGVLRRQSAHMAHLVDELLEVSRIACGKVKLRHQPVELRGVLNEVSNDHAVGFEHRGLTLERELGEHPLWVSGERVRLAQVFANLISNAIKFSPSGGRVRVSLHGDEGHGVVLIQDEGVGIRSELLSRIFEPFQQEQQDIARTSGGLGLGLALARELVELHGGTISARSDGPGKGALFEVRLPLLDEPERSSAESRSGDEKTPRRVMVVEDNADAAEMLSLLLDGEGHDVHVFETAPSALDALPELRPDAVVCDIGLPEMDGFEFARRVRSQPRTKNLPLIALTGYGQAQDRQRSAAAGFDEHLVKPVDLDVLGGLIVRHTGRSSEGGCTEAGGQSAVPSAGIDASP